MIYAETRTANGSTTTIHYLFDDKGQRFGFVVNGTDAYYYRFNLQGDVTGIYNSSGALITEYTYDAWGKLLSTTGTAADTIGSLNPIRYRGYYYDTETGFYHLQTRYYDPEVGRFINADELLDQSTILGMNLFAYCLNNPIMLVDPFGLCAKAWAAGYQGPCPGQGLPGCMDNWPQFQDMSTIVSAIDPNSPPDHPDYVPPKKNKGGKVKNPNGPGRGWPAKDGGVWIPDLDMHGGEGWTIQYPGGGHSHAYPGGGVRNHFELEQTTGKSIIMIFGGAAATIYLIANDVTGFGAADDPWLAGSMACFVAGVDGLAGKKVCAVCGEVKYGY